MSQTWRTAKGIRYVAGGVHEPVPQADDSNVYEGYQAYDPSASDNNVMLPISTNDLLVAASAQFPGNREHYHPMAAGGPTLMQYGYSGPGVIRDNVDWEIGGQSGVLNDNPYSTGVVGRDIDDIHAMGGQQALIRRGRNPAEVGAVATSDYNSLLAISYAQAAAGYMPSEAAQADLVRVV